MLYILKKILNFLKKNDTTYWIIFYIIVYVIFIIKYATIKNFGQNLLFEAYSLTISLYILSRFALAYFYAPESEKFDRNFQPTVSFGVPTKNEEQNIQETILRIAASDYPKEKFDIIAVNDGSSDNTLAEMKKAQRKAAFEYGVKVKIIDFGTNRGKREGMAVCTRESNKDIIVFIDSDSFVKSDMLKELVKYFIDKKIGGVAGHAYVANEEKNILTKMQAVRYYVAFKAYKAAESLFGTVTCASGCCAAYRRSYVMEVIDSWRNQKFLGVRCTYGDDRSLTNSLLEKNYEVVYAPEAISYTFVPSTFKQFMRQQLRWKKSWLRENLRASKFIWKKNILMSVSFYLGFVLPILAPLVLIRALIWYPTTTGNFPYFYITGLLLMTLLYSLYYYIHTKDRAWLYGAVFSLFYSLILVWQLPWAMINIRDPKWGTR